MRITLRKGRRHRLLLELTPMVDVVFLLIIFFMVTSEFARDARAELNLPPLPGEQSEAQEEVGLVINITAEGSIILSSREEPIELGRLEGRIEQYLNERESGRITLRADRAASLEIFNQVVGLLDQAGVSRTRIATEIPR